NETIPVVAAIAQTRNGKDELLHGTVPFVPAGGLYVPVSAANRLPVEATLSGSVTPGQRYEIETIHDAVTLAPGETTPAVLVPVNGANILFLAINVSESGWSLVYNHSAPFGAGTSLSVEFGYPKYEKATFSSPTTQIPVLV